MAPIRRAALLLFLAGIVALSMVGCGEPTSVEEPLQSTPTPGPTPATPTGDLISVAEHFQRGNEFTQAKEYDKAIIEFEAVLKADPKNVSALSNLGVVYYNLRRLDDAIAQYQKAIEFAPKDADIRSNLAAVYVQKGQLENALEQYQTAVALNPQLAEAYFGMGVVYQQMTKIDEAIQAFEKFQSLDTGKDAMASDLAKQYLQQLKGD